VAVEEARYLVTRLRRRLEGDGAPVGGVPDELVPSGRRPRPSGPVRSLEQGATP